MPLDHQLARSLVGLDLRLFLHREDLLEGGHRDLDHVVRGLARRQPLHLQPGPDQYPDHRVVLVPRAPHDELEGDPSHQRDDDEPANDHEKPPLDPEQGEHQDAQDQHVQNEARPAADVARVQLAGVLGDELLAALVDLYRLVLRAVVGEEALHVLAYEGDPDQVSDEDGDPDDAFHQVEDDGVLDALAEQRPYPFGPENRRYQ